MKTTIFLFMATLILMPLFAQEKFIISNESTDSKCKDLVVQLNIIVLFGQEFAKSRAMTASQYGEYVAEQYIKQGFTEGGNFEALTHACLYNLSCFIPDSEIEIITQTSEMVKIKSTMMHGFKNDKSLFLITGKDYQDYFTAALKVLAKYGGCNYESVNEGELVYTTITKD